MLPTGHYGKFTIETLFPFTDDLLHLGVASRCHKARGSVPEQMGVGSLDQDQVDSQGTRWRRFRTGDPLQESLVNMSVLDPFLRVLSHGGESRIPALT